MLRHWLLLCGIALLGLGCGGGGGGGGANGTGGGQGNNNGGGAAAGGAGGAQQIERTVGGKRWIGDVPRDVYFGDPLQVAADRRPVGGGATGNGKRGMGVPVAKNGTKTTAAKNGSTSGGTESGSDWETLIPIATLESEVKAIRNQLNARTQNVGKFNTAIKEIPPDAATLAVLASVVAEHSGKISWKPNARYIRDLAAEMLAEDLIRGRKSFAQVQLPYEKIVQIFDGNTPAELPESKQRVAFSDVAAFGHLMQRIDRGFKWIRSNARNEEAYKEHGEKVRHEVVVMGVIARVINEEGYGWSDDEDFVKFAAEMLVSCQKMEMAIKAEQFTDYTAALTKLDQMCTRCHMGRR